MNRNTKTPELHVIAAALALANLVPAEIAAETAAEAESKRPGRPSTDKPRPVESIATINEALANLATRPRRSSASRWFPAAEDTIKPIRENDLPFLRECLDEIIERGKLSADSRAKLTEKYLPNVAGSVVLIDKADGEQFEFYPELTGVASTVAYAVGLLVDVRKGLGKRLGKCKECGLYFLDVPKGSGKYREEFCETKHRNRYNQREARK